MKTTKVFVIIAVIVVVLALMSTEVDARRKILKGRKTVTRTYYTESILPAWAIILLTAIGEIILGGIVFLIMRWKILSPAETAIAGHYQVARQNE